MAQAVEYRVFKTGRTEELEAKLNAAAGTGFRLAQAVYTGYTDVLFVIVERPTPAAAMDPPDTD